MKSGSTRRKFIGQAALALASGLLTKGELRSAGGGQGELTLDITGNWDAGDLPRYRIQTREPRLKDGEKKSFSQILEMPAGPWSVEFEYDPEQDMHEFAALGGAPTGFSGFRVDGRPLKLDFRKEGVRYVARCEQEERLRAGPMRLDMELANTRPLETRIVFMPDARRASAYQPLPPGESGEFLLARGIPFNLRSLCFFDSFIDRTHSGKDMGLDRGSLLHPGGSVKLACHGARVKTAYFLGMIHNIDVAHGGSLCRRGDHGYSHFVGDQAGEISIGWQDGGSRTVPLVFGYNLWFSRPWDMFWFFRMYGVLQGEGNFDAKLYGGRDEPRRIISDNLQLRDAVRAMGSLSCNARFVFSLDLDGRSVEWIAIKGHPQMHDYPLVSAVTLEVADYCPALPSLPDLSTEKLPARPATVSSADRQDWQEGAGKIKHLFYSFVDETPALETPEVPAGYFGPRFDFRGAREAVYAATYLYRNGPECAAYIADSGLGCSSTTAHMALAHYKFGIGTWRTVEPLYQSLEH